MIVYALVLCISYCFSKLYKRTVFRIENDGTQEIKNEKVTLNTLENS